MRAKMRILNVAPLCLRLARSYLVMHARRPWSGDGPRKVLASLIMEPNAPLPVVGAVVNARPSAQTLDESTNTQLT